MTNLEQEIKMAHLSAQSPNVRTRHRAAENPLCPEEDLLRLADDIDWYVQVGVAENPAAPVDLLRYLFRKKPQHAEVRRAVARNVKCPQDIMDEILEDPEWTVREGLALNQECPTEILGELSQDKSWEVRRMVVRNPKTSKGTLWMLRKDPDNLVATIAKRMLLSK